MLLPSDIATNFRATCSDSLPVEVTLGSPRDKNCRHQGICRIHLRGNSPAVDCPTAATIDGHVRLDDTTGRLLIHFHVDTLGTDVRAFHFPRNVLTVPYAYALSPTIRERLGLTTDQDYHILPGRYPALAAFDYLTLSLALQQGLARVEREEDLAARAA